MNNNNNNNNKQQLSLQKPKDIYDYVNPTEFNKVRDQLLHETPEEGAMKEEMRQKEKRRRLSPLYDQQLFIEVPRFGLPRRFSTDGRLITNSGTPSIPVFYLKKYAQGPRLERAIDGQDNVMLDEDGDELSYTTTENELYDEEEHPLGINAFGEDIQKYRVATIDEQGIQRNKYGDIVRTPHDVYMWVTNNYPEIVQNLPRPEDAETLETREAIEEYNNKISEYEDRISHALAREAPQKISASSKGGNKRNRNTYRKKNTRTKSTRTNNRFRKSRSRKSRAKKSRKHRRSRK